MPVACIQVTCWVMSAEAHAHGTVNSPETMRTSETPLRRSERVSSRASARPHGRLPGEHSWQSRQPAVPHRRPSAPSAPPHQGRRRTPSGDEPHARLACPSHPSSVSTILAMEERGWGWTATQIRQAQFIEWLAPRSSSATYVLVKPFYDAQPGQQALTIAVVHDELGSWTGDP